MIRFLCLGWPLLGSLLGMLVLPVGAWAAQPDPLDAEAATPALVYRSPLANEQGPDPVPLLNWREANELVGRIGGWRTYALEPWEEPVDAAVAAPGTEQPASPHAAHDRQGVDR